MASPKISLRGVTKAFGQKKVLQGIELDVAPGESMVVIGGSGTGKSVLLKCILGLIAPTRGHIHTPFDRQPAGYVPQQKSIDPLYPVTTRQIVEMGLFPELGWWKRPGPGPRRRVDEVLDRLGLAEHQTKAFSELSGGMKQKTLLGRALVSNAEVFIMDEPTSELDENSEKEVMAHLSAMTRDEGKTVLLAHHGLDQAGALASTVCVVHHGRASLAAVDDAHRLLRGTFSAGGRGND